MLTPKGKSYVLFINISSRVWLYQDGKATNLVIVQSTGLDISVVLFWCWSSIGFLEDCWSLVYIWSLMSLKEVDSVIDEGMAQKKNR